MGLELPRVRCAAFHRGLAVDPGGSAGAYDAFLCVEVPLPWGRDVSEHEPFAALGAGASISGGDGRRWRPQGLVPRGDTDGAVRVLAFESGGSPGPFARREWWVDSTQLSGLCSALVSGDPSACAEFERSRVHVDHDLLDVLVCTHGRRDTCCGSSGSVLVEQAGVALTEVGRGRIRLWRTTHTGGHRFAPTALTFPDGAAWSHLDVVSLGAVVRRDAPVGEVVGQLRGVTSVQGAARQMADRFALAEVGWSWLGCRRRVEVVDFDRSTLDTTVLVEADGYAATVVVGLARHVPQPTCGELDAPEYSVEPEWTARRAADRPTVAQ